VSQGVKVAGVDGPGYHGLDYDPVALYQMSDGTGTDSSGNGLHLTGNGGIVTQPIPGFPGTRLTGGAYFWRASNDALLTIPGAITVECLICIEQTPFDSPAAVLLSFQGPTEDQADNILYDCRVYGLNWYSSMEYGPGTTEQRGSTAGGNWTYSPYHMAWTRNADGKTENWYLNGVLADTVVGTGVPDGGTAARLMVGATSTGGSLWYRWLASLKIIPFELSADQVKQEYNRTLGRAYGMVT
jgi:hypothetical protein